LHETHKLSSHSNCFACGECNSGGLGLNFVRREDGIVSAEYVVGGCYQGYPGIAQGGIVATLLDSAMTNCLFSEGIEAMTAQLSVRYREPVKVGVPLTIEAVLRNKHGRLYELSASIKQEESVRATATAKFILTIQQADKSYMSGKKDLSAENAESR